MQLEMKFGKFDSIDSLQKGYDELEKEFTKRCQKLKELERENQRLSATLSDKEFLTQNAVGLLADATFVSDYVAGNDCVKNMVIENYLDSLSKGVSVLGANSGRPALAPPSSARTLSEAKALADRILSGNL